MIVLIRRISSPVLLSILMLFVVAMAVHGQVDSTIYDMAAEFQFGEEISFSARLDTSLQVETVDLTFKPTTNGKSKVVSAQFNQSNQLTARYQIDPKDYLPPFSTIEFWFSVRFTDGSQIESAPATFIYEDNRYTWQSLRNNGDYKIFWVEGSRSLGQSALDSIEKNLDTYNTYLDLPEPDTLRVYLYHTPSALQSALEITNARWVAGHADLTENTILVSVPSGFDQNLEIQRKIPHEVVHIRLYLYLQDDYPNLPIWYSEGLASLGELYSSTEYWPILQAGWKNNQLIPISELCQSFPSDVNDARLAYAQAESFTRYLFETYGSIGLQALLDAYKAGHTCDNGLRTTFNLGLADIEKEWKQATFRRSFFSQADNPASAWLFLSLILLIPPISYATIYLVRNKNRSSDGRANE